MQTSWDLKKSRGRISALFILLTLLGMTLSACASASGDLAVGDPAPAFTLTSEKGERVSLADYRGMQPVLLFFHMADG